MNKQAKETNHNNKFYSNIEYWDEDTLMSRHGDDAGFGSVRSCALLLALNHSLAVTMN